MKILIQPSAKGDLAEGVDFYEKQEPGLGAYFLDSLFSDINSLRVYAGTHRKVFGYHKLHSKRFPFAVYYATEADVIFIKAVLDCRRDPEWIRRRLA